MVDSKDQEIRKLTKDFHWEYQFLLETCLQYLGGYFSRLEGDVNGLEEARGIFEELCSLKGKEARENALKRDNASQIQEAIDSIEKFISLQPPLGDGFIYKLEELLGEEENAEACAKYLMEKALKIFLKTIRLWKKN